MCALLAPRCMTYDHSVCLVPRQHASQQHLYGGGVSCYSSVRTLLTLRTLHTCCMMYMVSTISRGQQLNLLQVHAATSMGGCKDDSACTLAHCSIVNCGGLHRHLFDVMLPLLCRRRGTSDRAAVPLFSTYHHCQVYCRQVRVSMAAVPHRRRVQRAQLQLHRTGDGCSLLAGHCPCSCTAAGQGCAALTAVALHSE